MSAERPWADAPREMLEQQLARLAAEVARLTTESTGLAEVIAMQMDFIEPQPAAPPEIIKDGLTGDGYEWFEKLVDRLELYLVRTVGERRPLRIDDPDLRALVQHIRD